MYILSGNEKEKQERKSLIREPFWCVYIFFWLSIYFVALLYNYHLVFAFKRIHLHTRPLFFPCANIPIHKYTDSFTTSRLRFKCSRKAIVFICTLFLALTLFLFVACHILFGCGCGRRRRRRCRCCCYFNRFAWFILLLFGINYLIYTVTLVWLCVFSNAPYHKTAFTLSQQDIFAIPIHLYTYTKRTTSICVPAAYVYVHNV